MNRLGKDALEDTEELADIIFKVMVTPRADKDKDH